MPRRYRTRSLVVVSVLVMAAAVWFGGKAQQSASDEGTETVRDARSMLIARLDVETGLRGFLLTGNERFLKPYLVGIRRYRDASTRMASRIGTLGDEGRRLLAEQDALTRRWLAGSSRAIAAHRAGQALPLGWLAASKGGMDRFRRSNTALQNLGEEHQAELQDRARDILLAIIGLVALVAVAVAYFLIERPAHRTTRRRAKQSEFAHALQYASDEKEAQSLLVKALNRAIPDVSAVVFSVNNSENRLEAATDLSADMPLRQRMPTAVPKDCLAVRQGQPFERSAGRERLIECELCGATGANSVCLPSVVGGEVIGSVLLSRERKPLSAGERRGFERTVSTAAPVLANLRNLAIAETRAVTDSLTGLANTRAAAQDMDRMAAFALRTGTPLTVVMLDLDHFKRINDAFGHHIGDEVLANLGGVLRQGTRTSDFIARYGGEEFLILLQDTDLRNGVEVAENLRASVRQIQVPGFTGRISASFGVASMPMHARDAETLVRLADQALYAAKNSGRDRVCTPPEPDPASLLEELNT